MPGRKRSSISQYTRSRKRMRLNRSQQSEEERQGRLMNERERQTNLRAAENDSEHQSRLNLQRERMALARSAECLEERQERQRRDQECHTEARAAETSTQRVQRLAADCARHELSRESETFTERDSRLTADRERHSLSRESETFTERESRLTADRERHSLSRESETFTERDSRLTADRERHSLSRESETFTERESRLTADREHHALSRASETYTQYETRLEAGREYYHNRREDRVVTLSIERERIAEIRSNENVEHREARLTTDRLHHILNRVSISSQSDDESEEIIQVNDVLPWINKEGSGFSYTVSINYAQFSVIGAMTKICRYCQALKWTKETDGVCCSNGKVRLNIFDDSPPEPLKSLLTGEHPHSKQFLDSIRSYNSAFQMTSFGAKEVFEGAFMPTFKIQGQVYHAIGSLLPENEAKFLQIYFISDYTQQANIRGRNFPNLNTELLRELQNMLHGVNPYVHSFKAAIESVPQDRIINRKFVINADKRPPQEHRSRFNAPTVDEVAVVLVDQECDRRDIVLRARDDRLQRISETHRAYDALQYPLIYCRGEDGYNFSVYNVDPQTGAPNYNKKTSAMQFYSYHLQIRHDRFVYLQRFRGLFSQFVVDMYAKIETERLVYIRTNQKKLRAENYVDLQDAMQNDVDVDNLGRLVILPSSFTGGPRYMNKRVQDAFCYVRKYGRPDLFITITTNPKWEEITNLLLPGQVSYDRHDVIARVFHLKLKLLMDLLTKENIFGHTLCFMYSVEWQKRGLPHAHILLWLQNKLRPNEVDNMIRAELPNPNEDPALYDIVKTHMIHGPCGTLNLSSPCMKDGRCTKRFPKALINDTQTGEDGYPKYRRRSPAQGGYTAEIRSRGQQITVDNRWIVPYSPVLSKTFAAHINVEMCNSVEAIKYILKYINKGADQATFGARNERDEVSRYQTGRYISSSESVWRILNFPIHQHHPSVFHLDVHLEGGQRIYFDTNNVRQQLENPRETTLLSFFNLCESDNFAKSLLYEEVPSYYTYNRQRGNFNRRRRGIPVEGVIGVFKDHVIGRVYTVHPNNAECFYLRMLLHIIRGPTSFTALKAFNGIEYETFQAACRARGLLDDDQHWDNALSEACLSNSPHRLRHLFAVMMVFCALSDAAKLWQKYQHQLAQDFLHQAQGDTSDCINREPLSEAILNRCLSAIQEVVTSIGGNALSQYGLPEPNINERYHNSEYSSETNYDPLQLAQILREQTPCLTTEQKRIFERVCYSANNNLGEMFFLDAPGGTGKTFLTKIILVKLRSEGKVVLAVASSGIASTLLPGGKTAHAMFKIPLQLDYNDSPVCNISRNSDKAVVLRDCSLIVWDECTMAHRKAIEAVNKTLQDIRHCDQPMGGVTILFCGDFRQTLPVVPRGTRADEINACLKSSSLWANITRMHLTVNMRACRGDNPNAEEFSRLLLKIGNGTYPEETGKIKLQESLCHTVSSLEALISAVYGDPALIPSFQNSWICERAILTPRNDQAAIINKSILERVVGESIEYTSINRVVDEMDATHYPVEFLNSLNAPGLPSHKIILKIGVPIILLRNLSPPKLCNGTRLKVVSLQPNIIEAEVLTGCAMGESVFIPRIPLIPNNFPFQFKRVQFPVSVCFAMTINKAQGQTLHTAGIDLSTPCFSHGQLYVAFSRVSDAKNLFVYVPEDTTSNIVYKEAL